MLTCPTHRPIYFCAVPVDFRKSFDGLTGVITSVFELSVLDGHLFLFINKRRDRIKAMWWDRDGIVIIYKLEGGRLLSGRASLRFPRRWIPSETTPECHHWPSEKCLDCWKQVIDHAKEKKVTLVLEHLNSRDNSHPMKGHPGYFGDGVERCIDLVKRMDSPRFKVLFDVYHVQIMNGDVICRIQMYHPLIGHYHTAGNPGRCELYETQEIHYPAVMNAIVATGYTGFVAQEFIPTWSDPVLAMRHSEMVCDV